VPAERPISEWSLHPRIPAFSPESKPLISPCAKYNRPPDAARRVFAASPVASGNPRVRPVPPRCEKWKEIGFAMPVKVIRAERRPANRHL